MLPTVAKKTRKIPDYLIYEEIDGKPIYYHIITDWSEEVEVLDCTFSLTKLLEAEGLDLSAMGK